MKIYITNLEKYNNGELVGKWVTLPLSNFDTEFEDILKEIGNPEEYFISDYECDYYDINEYENIKDLNALAEYYEGLDEHDQIKLKYVIDDQRLTIKDALDFELGDIMFYQNMNLEEVAECRVDESLFGEIPESIKNYIDYKAIAIDLDCEGYVETDQGVFYCY